ncbi:class I SAM-dependent methyltransferase [Humibacter sp.]|uniref:class I SAM-dependent methyltransferase n=1 Tax=Humibacter sp. TaxID=1940291 RepID=UPI002CABAF35|nr:class I SAM-dependent methyltransferase [Humibacter sp.]HVX07922.1 class I SAM-dependent methyltransferase [Humibacter sp.]
MLREILQKLPVEQRLRLRSHVQRVWALPYHRDLDRLARIYRTDKASTEHAYTRYYLRHLPPRRAVRSVLEIGVGGVNSKFGYASAFGGQSLRMWRDYFPHAEIVGLDIERKRVPGNRITVVQGSQDDPQLLARIAHEHGPFDVVIDDGSHVAAHLTASHAALFEHVRPGGVYVIEDLATAYIPAAGGGPPGTAGTSIELLKSAIDDVMRSHWDAASDRAAVDEVHVYDEIAFLVRH